MADGLAAGAPVTTVQLVLCSREAALAIGATGWVLRRARRRPVPLETTCPYPGWSGDKHVLGKVGLNIATAMRSIKQSLLAENLPEQRYEIVANRPSDTEIREKSAIRRIAQRGSRPTDVKAVMRPVISLVMGTSIDMSRLYLLRKASKFPESSGSPHELCE